MSYGLEAWGVASYGGSDFIVSDHFPFDNSTGINRLPTISFVLASQGSNVTISSINLVITINGTSIQLITNGLFTSNAIGTINASNPTNVIVSATLLHALAPLDVVNVNVVATNTFNQTPIEGAWQFTVNSAIATFLVYIVNAFQKVLRVGT
jgi:hypothetical protein